MQYLQRVLEQRAYWFFTQIPVSINHWSGEIGCFINRIASNFLFCSYDTRISFNNLLTVLRFLLTVLFCILLQKCSLIWITFWAKLRLGRSHPAISSLFYLFILIYYLQWCSSLILRTCAYEGVRNVSFSKDFAYVLNR